MAVCVFCSSSEGLPASAQALASALGASLAREGFRLVYGGGNRGLMGLTASAALKGSGEVVGVIPHWLQSREGEALNLTQLDIVDNMLVRKERMMEASDAFIAIPGGIGTLDEITDVLTHFDLRKHSKPMILIDVDGFWQPLLQWLTLARNYGTVRDHLFEGLTVVPSLDLAMDCLKRLAARRDGP